jgi:hypothetical protein
MSTFSGESLLLIEHWSTVRDILKARDRLAEELIAVLLSLESELKQMDWWDDEWYFRQWGRRPQVFISNRGWKKGEKGAIRIGVWRMEPEHVFVPQSPAGLYVYVTRRNEELLAALVERLQGVEETLPGEVDTRMSNYNAAQQDIRPYVGGDVEVYISELKQEILAYFSSYAGYLSSIDNVIQQYI